MMSLGSLEEEETGHLYVHPGLRRPEERPWPGIWLVLLRRRGTPRGR